MKCPICGATASEPKFFQSFRGKEINISYSACPDCEVAFQVPMLTAEQSDTFYATDQYRKLISNGAVVTSDNLHGQFMRASRIVPYITERLPSVRHHLDVGSCAGALCNTVQQAYGASTQGVELSEGFLAYSNANGVLASATWPNGNSRFDLITIVHTLEHVVDPVGMLRQARALLSGQLYVEVPMNQPDVVHPYVFSPPALGRALAIAGFEVDELGPVEDAMLQNATDNLVAWAH